jgi:energy-coupling factor transport system substrate-specific component
MTRQRSRKRLNDTAAAPQAGLWAFGRREVVQGVAGAALYAVLFWVFKAFPLPIPLRPDVFIRPSLAVPLFVGLMFGPAVGGFTGVVGHVAGDLLTGAGLNWPWALGSGLMGVIPGLARYFVSEFRTPREFGLAELFTLLGVWGGSAFAALVGETLVLRRSDLAAGLNKTMAEGLTGTLNGGLLMPTLILIWNALRERR